ncbi:hypothetical protein HMPREF1142_2017 [Peptostreptococcaceae bacterium AS15]|nr:hypothetical protein HMPREF1142_2017 [Peptostreptococcaceae bacterium AS15]
MNFTINKNKNAFLNEEDLWIIGFQSFIIALVSSLCVYLLFRNGIQRYADIAVGNITTLGIFKSVDFYLYYSFIFIFISVFFIIYFYKKSRYKVINTKKSKNTLLLLTLLLVFPSCFVYFFRIYQYETYKVIVFSILCFSFFIAYYFSKKINIAIDVLICEFFIFLSCSALGALLFKLTDMTSRNVFLLSFFIFCISVFLYMYMFIIHFKGEREELLNKSFILSQFLIPFNLLSIINKRYIYLENPYYLKYFDRFEYLISFLIGICIVYNVLMIIFKKNNYKINISTLFIICVVTLWDHNYSLLIEQDQFHTGETAIVFSQIFDKGQIWNKEFVSVLQGLGLIVSGINKFLFYGKFSMFYQTNNVVKVIFSTGAFLALVGIIKDRRKLLFFIPIMSIFIFNRGFAIPITFLLLINPYLIRKVKLWIYTYAFLCIFNIFFQPTYGGVMAVSFLPIAFVLLYNDIKDTGIKSYINNRINIIFILSLVCIFLFSIPLIIDALIFLIDNSYQTQITNGIALKQQIITEPIPLSGFHFIDKFFTLFMAYGISFLSFSFLFIFFVVYVKKEEDFTRKIQGVCLTLIPCTSFILWLPAILTRIDYGITRIGYISIIMVSLFSPTLIYLYRKRIKDKLLIFFFSTIIAVIIIYYNTPIFLPYMGNMAMEIKIPSDYKKIDDGVVDGLGEAFINNENYVEEAKAIKMLSDTVLSDNQTYYDFTDKSIYYYYSGRRVPGLYVSSMICANDKLQKKAIEKLKKEDIPLIFINNPLRFIQVSESLRSYRIYKYFMTKNYRYINYNNIDFLLRDDVDFSKLIENYNTSTVLSIEKFLKNVKVIDTIYNNNITYISCLEKSGDSGYIVKDWDPFIIYKPNHEYSPKSIDAVKINFSNKTIKNFQGEIFIAYEENGEEKLINQKFLASENRTVIPIFLNSNSISSLPIKYIRVDWDNLHNGDSVAIKSIDILYLNDDVKKTIKDNFINEDTIDKINNFFHQENLGYLPEQWGYNWEELESRFKEVSTLKISVSQDNLDNNIVYFDEKENIDGKTGDFLLMNLVNNHIENKNEMLEIELTVNVTGKNNNKYSDKFLFTTKGNKLLVPIGTSYKILSSNRIDNIIYRIVKNDKEVYNGKVEFKLYSLID